MMPLFVVIFGVLWFNSFNAKKVSLLNGSKTLLYSLSNQI